MLTPCFSIAITQYIGLPLYFYSQDLFYAWMAMTKQHFSMVVTTMTFWWAPVTMRVSGDESIRGQMRKKDDGLLECDFPERLVFVSNHQVWLLKQLLQRGPLTPARSTPTGSTSGG
jgi:lysocardiolipin and lysophospholipid acyltransferase